MNKKAFTLVEIILTISLLSIVMILVATKGLGLFDLGKKKIEIINKNSILESYELLKIDLENCDDYDDDLLNLFNSNNCNELFDKLKNEGLDITLDKMVKMNYIDNNTIESFNISNVENLNKIEYYSTNFKMVNGKVSYSAIPKAILGHAFLDSTLKKLGLNKENVVEVYFEKGVDFSKELVEVSVDNMSEEKIYAWTESDEVDVNNKKIHIVSDGKIFAPSSITQIFYKFSNLQKIDFENFDTSIVKEMYGTFRECISLETLDLSNFNTKNVHNMGTMFYECTSLKDIAFGDDFDTSNVTNMSWMFGFAKSLTTLDLSKFTTDPAVIENMSKMFYSCTDLTNLNIREIKTSDKTNVAAILNLTNSLNNVCINEKNSKLIFDIVQSKNISISCD